MARVAVAAPVLFHPGLEDVPQTLLKFVTHLALVVSEHTPVTVVELFDDLECPSSVQHIAAHQLGFQPAGDLVVAGGAQLVTRVTEQQVGVPHQLMEGVQVTAGPLDELQGLGQFSDRFDRLVADTVRPAALVSGDIGTLRHRYVVPREVGSEPRTAELFNGLRRDERS